MTMMMDNNDENSNMRSILHPLSILRVQGIFIFPLLKNCGVSSKAFRISDDGKTRLEPGKSVLSKYLEGENGLQGFFSKHFTRVAFVAMDGQVGLIIHLHSIFANYNMQRGGKSTKSIKSLNPNGLLAHLHSCLVKVFLILP